MVELSRGVDVSEPAGVLHAIVELVLPEESGLLDSLTDEAQADFVVPLGMCAKMLSSGEYSEMESVSAACTVSHCAAAHMSEFPDDLARMVSRLPR
ncbi:hypothetical protein Srubr_34830 [Streptomyces rubradiris]|uniref:Uncharacterized protein n=2 Tax=Streptomyces rubradiris TaxID=285531 RepID=A0ABQ3RCQ8_STRRR|nr:hypothetical protein GCM10018792_03760 [Streptomyces rubradiris]GHI53637.1 hypothetical protein Srubr_34830 [Streptomyces rubradiris]